MTTWKEITVTPETSIRDTLRVIDAGSLQIALVTDGTGRLVGTVTDGDVRRGILRNLSVDAPVQNIMNASPTAAAASDSAEEILATMKLKQLRQIPLIDNEGRLVGIEVLEDLLHANDRPNWVVLMAGGFGTRLRPLTDDCPKPLLKVGNKPLLQTILENFIQYSALDFFEPGFGCFNQADVAVSFRQDPIVIVPQPRTVPLVAEPFEIGEPIEFARR